MEVDFVAINSKVIEYYKVSESTKEKLTLERKLKPLYNIKDYYPRYLLTMDVEPETSYDGIRKLYVLDWLLQK